METTLIFYSEELIYDIKARAFAAARSKVEKSENPDKDDHWLMDVAQEQWPESMHQEIANRLMSLAFNHCASILAAICSDVVEDGFIGSDQFKTVEKYVMHLSFNSAKEGQLKFLKSLIHEFIVYKVLYHWCELVAPEHLEIFGARVKDLEDSLSSLVNKFNQGGNARHYFPF